MAEKSTGWPKNEGPRPILLRYGLIKSIDEIPPWANRAHHFVNFKQQLVYSATSTFFGEHAVRSFAALSLEGYRLTITAQSSRLIRADLSPPKP